MLNHFTKIFHLNIIGTILILSSCNGNQHADKLQKIDSLNMVLDKAELIFEEINIDSLRVLFPVFQNNSEEIKKYYTKEDEEGWKVICRYTDMKKPFRNVVEYYDNIRTEINYSRQQLDSLQHDLQNNIITEDLAIKYLSDEEKAVGTLSKMILNDLATSKVIMHDFDSLNTLVEEIIVRSIRKSGSGSDS